MISLLYHQNTTFAMLCCSTTDYLDEGERDRLLPAPTLSPAIHLVVWSIRDGVGAKIEIRVHTGGTADAAAVQPQGVGRNTDAVLIHVLCLHLVAEA